MGDFCEIGLDFKGKYKKRAIHSFVNATEQIMTEEGLDRVTIRKISDLAGYSSATIYSYFDNIEHLILFSSMKFLDEYIKAIPKYISSANSALDLFKKMWDCFCTHSFKKADVYNTMFFSKLENNSKNYMQDYYCVYPIEDEGYPEIVKQVLRESNIYKRNYILISNCAKEGFIQAENIDEINEMTIFIYESILHRVCTGDLDSISAEQKMQKYLNRILDMGLLQRSEEANANKKP